MTALALAPRPSLEDQAVDHLLWLASRWRDVSAWTPCARAPEQDHILNGVRATISDLALTSDPTGATLAGRWHWLCEAVDRRERLEIGALGLDEALGCPGRHVEDSHANNEHARTRLDAEALDCARQLYRGGRS